MGLPDISRRTVGHAFDRVLRIDPDKTGHISDSESYTWGDVHTRSLRIAGGLREFHVERGEPVLFMLRNTLDAVHLWLGMSLTGIVEVPINTAYKGAFLAHIIRDSGAAVIVLEAEFLPRFLEVAHECPNVSTAVVRGEFDRSALQGCSVRAVPFEELLESPPASPIAVAPDDLIALMYTSGTTGRSKGGPHPACPGVHVRVVGGLGLPAPDDRLYVVLPLFHLSGQWHGMYQALIGGASAVLRDAFSLSGFMPDIRRHGATSTLLIGAMAQLIHRAVSAEDAADNPLRYVVMAPLIPQWREFQDKFDVQLATGFGMTECGMPLTAPPGTVCNDSAGKVRPGFQVRVVDDHDIDAPIGTTGELVIRADTPWTLMDGYHGLPEKTADAWRNLWLHTGDAFRRDEDGYFYFVDRIKDAIRRRGENISSSELEAEISKLPGIRECVVVAAPSPLTEDDIRLVVVPDNTEVTEIDVLRLCEDRLPGFMVPRYIQFVDALPKTPTERVKKSEVREWSLDGVFDREALAH